MHSGRAASLRQLSFSFGLTDTSDQYTIRQERWPKYSTPFSTHDVTIVSFSKSLLPMPPPTALTNFLATGTPLLAARHLHDQWSRFSAHGWLAFIVFRRRSRTCRFAFIVQLQRQLRRVYIVKRVLTSTSGCPWNGSIQRRHSSTGGDYRAAVLYFTQLSGQVQSFSRLNTSYKF